MLLKGCLKITVFVACSAALAGCGGLRRLPLNADGDAGPTGSAGSCGRRGRQLRRRHGRQRRRQHGDTDGGLDDAMFVDSGNVDVPVSNCVAGGACVPANPCHKGMFVCNEGAMTCMELTDMQANGTVCGTDMVCRNGTCGACTEGMACDVTGKPCRVGSIVCTTGAPVCTETDNKPNGTMLRHGDGLPGGQRARPARRAARARRRTGATPGRWSARARRRRAPTPTPTSPPGRPAGRTWSAAQRHLRGVRRAA